MTKYRHAPSVLATELAGGEVVMMDADLAKYFGLVETATVIWAMFADPTSVDQVVDALTEQYEVAADVCRTETLAFVDELLDRNLLVAAS